MSNDEEDDYTPWDPTESGYDEDGMEGDDDDEQDEEMTDERWKRTPKTWSTLMLLTSLRPGNEAKKAPTDEEMTRAAIGLLKEEDFQASWCMLSAEMIFWPTSIPLDEVRSDSI